jgi:hypothetical protein
MTRTRNMEDTKERIGNSECIAICRVEIVSHILSAKLVKELRDDAQFQEIHSSLKCSHR